MAGRFLAGGRLGFGRLVGRMGLTILLSSRAMLVPGATPEGSIDPRSAGTLRMVERLTEIARKADPLLNPYRSADQIEPLRQKRAARPGLAQDPAYHFQLGEALLNSGRNVEAVGEFRTVVRRTLDQGGRVSANYRRELNLLEALCHLREAERVNCLSNHNAESCLFPLSGGGIHEWTDPARDAIGVLTNLLVQIPEDRAARWLLNVASMMVGDYPARIPEPWLIPSACFQSDTAFPRFPEIAASVGLAPSSLSGGSVVDDFDGDGFLDVMVSSFGIQDQLRLYRSNGDGTFAERTLAAGLEGLVGGLNLVPADYDNDGDLDVLVLRGAWMREEGRHPNSLLRNRGDGSFEDVTEAAGLLSFHPTQTAAWFDFDGDGWLDVFIGNETVSPRQPHPCELYRNRGDGTFGEQADRCGIAVQAYVKGVTSGDFNNDGRPDLFLSVLGGPNRLFRNEGPRAEGGGWFFSDVAREAGVTEPIQSFPCWFFDYDNDGWQDLLVFGYRIEDVGDVLADYLGLSHGGAKARLYRNRGNGTFADVSVDARMDRLLLAMGCNFGDLDNDGWLDFYVGTGAPDLFAIIPNRMFRNAGGRFFQDVTTAGGFGHLQKGHGVSFADLDNDGDQDIYQEMGGAVSGDVYPNALYHNPGFPHRWLKLRLEGDQANRSGVGARVRIDLQEGARVRSLHRTVGTGGSFGANPLRCEVGLGSADRIVGLEIAWPGSGTRQTIGGLQLDRVYVIREGAKHPHEEAIKPFRFPAPVPHAHPR